MPQYTTAIKIFPETMRSFNTATFTGAYQLLGTATTKPIRILKFFNSSNVVATISWDGTNDHDILPVGTWVEYPITACQSNVQGSQGLFVGQGTQFYIKGAAGIGLVYLVCMG